MFAARNGLVLVLGGGGARGWAHVGVLRQLQAWQVPVAGVVGTSAGAIVGAAFAAGRLDVLEDVLRHFDWHRAAQLFIEVGLPPRAGLVTGRRIVRLIREVLRVARIEELPLPFAAVATDLHARREVVLDRGDLAGAVRASIALPGIFTPVEREGLTLVDGGLVNPLPVSVARGGGARSVLAVDVNLRSGCGMADASGTPAPCGPVAAARTILGGLRRRLPVLEGRLDDAMRRWTERHAGPTILDVLTQSTRVIENQITHMRLQVDVPDLLLQPAVGDIATLDFARADAAIAAGEAAAAQARDAILALVRPQGPAPLP